MPAPVLIKQEHPISAQVYILHQIRPLNFKRVAPPQLKNVTKIHKLCTLVQLCPNLTQATAENHHFSPANETVNKTECNGVEQSGAECSRMKYSEARVSK